MMMHSTKLKAHCSTTMTDDHADKWKNFAKKVAAKRDNNRK